MDEPRIPDPDSDPDSSAGAGPPPVVPAGTRPRPRTNTLAWAMAGVGLVIALGVLGTLLLGGLGRPDADSAVGRATDDLREWDAITYRGAVPHAGAADLGVDLTVVGDGDMAGTLTRAGGGWAEYARIDGVEMIKADAAWWRSDPRAGRKAEWLAGMWLRNPSRPIDVVTSSSLVPPSALADDLYQARPFGSTISLYDESGRETVDGVPGRAIERLGRRMVVTEGSSPQLLSVQPEYSPARTSLRVSRPGPAALAAVDAARTAGATATDLTAKLSEQPRITLAWESAALPLCTTEICTVGTRITNTSPFAAEGSLSVTMNGREEGNHRFVLGPGRSATFTTRADNPGKARPNVEMPMDWRAYVTAS